jgi:hypothetical protein
LLHISSTGEPTLRIQDADLTNRYVDISQAGGGTFFRSRADASNGSFIFSGFGGGTDDEFMRIDNTGNVGIGTTSPSSLLTLRQTAASHQIIEISRPNSDTGALYLGNDTNNNAVIAANNRDICFGTDVSGTFSESARIDSSGRLLIGTSSAFSNTQALTSNITPKLQLNGEGADDSSFLLRRTNGAPYLNLANGSPVSNNDFVANINFQAYDGTNHIPAARIQAFVDGTPGANNMPGRLVFSTTENGAASPTERMRIANSGALWHLTTTGTINTTSFGVAVTSSTFGIAKNRAAGNSVLNVYGNAGQFRTMGDGAAENSTNSYGAISDASLKENVVDANSQWNDLKSIRVRNYNFKAETGYSTHTQIGVIAQEIELVSPGLVGNSIDDESGEAIKSVQYSVLYMKAVKALQEAMERIEVLEAKVNALEGN